MRERFGLYTKVDRGSYFGVLYLKLKVIDIFDISSLFITIFCWIITRL